MAVCRGKVSEGIDFADADARAVVITGIPYPSVFDPKVSLKKKFLDNSKTKTLSGSEWYNLEAFRAINQAVGRVIRHKEDFGAVLLLDKRFAIEANTSKLSSWLPKPQKFSNFKSSIKGLEEFFSQHSYTPSNKPKATFKAPLDPQMKKRPLTSNAAASSSSEILKAQSNQPPSKKKRIVIKPRSAISDQVPKDVSTKYASAEPTSKVSNGDEVKSQQPSSTAQPDIQRFVLSLKERLEKKELKQLILNVRTYKEKGDIQPLITLLKEFYQRKAVNGEDVKAFYPFIRSEDQHHLNSIYS